MQTEQMGRAVFDLKDAPHTVCLGFRGSWLYANGKAFGGLFPVLTPSVLCIVQRCKMAK